MRRFDLISDALPFGRLWYTEILPAMGYAKFRSRSDDAVIRVYDDMGNVIETHEHKAISKSRFSGVKIDWIGAQPRTVGGCLIG
jgi:hypothetical protein